MRVRRENWNRQEPGKRCTFQKHALVTYFLKPVSSCHNLPGTPSNYISVDWIRWTLIQSPLRSTPGWSKVSSINEPPEPSWSPTHSSINPKCRNAVGGSICLIRNERGGLGSQPRLQQHSLVRCPLKQRAINKTRTRNISPSTRL